MNRVLMISLCGLVTLGLMACENESSDDAAPASSEVRAQASGEIPEFHEEVDAREEDEFGVPVAAEPELVEAFHATLDERNMETMNRFDISWGPFQELLNTEVLADFEDVAMEGGAHNRIAREDLILGGLEDRSEAELIEICEAISEFLATVPEHVTMRGPVVFVGANYQLDETSSLPNHQVVTPVFFNETLAPGEPGECVVV